MRTWLSLVGLGCLVGFTACASEPVETSEDSHANVEVPSVHGDVGIVKDDLPPRLACVDWCLDRLYRCEDGCKLSRVPGCTGACDQYFDSCYRQCDVLFPR